MSPWAGLDDRFYDDPRVVEAGLAAAGLYACATSYCAAHLTDGVISKKALMRMLDGDTAPLDALVSVGLLRPLGDDFEVVDFLKANRSREQVEADRRRDAERKRRRRGDDGSPGRRVPW